MRATTKPPAVLLGGSDTALSVARALGRNRVPVDVLGDGLWDSAARTSRFCRYVPFPPTLDVQGPWLEHLLQGVPPSVLLPCSDDGVELVARHRAELVTAGHVPPEADDDVLLAMLDKEETYRRARAVGVPVPATTVIRSRVDLERVLDQGPSYPCGLKPLRSDVLQRRLPGVPKPKGSVLHDDDELVSAVEPAMRSGLPMIMTEIVAGGDDRYCSYYSYLDEDGLPLLHFTKRKLRQQPPGFGLGTYHLTQWLPDVAEMGLRLFQGLGLRGIGNVEFKKDGNDGLLKLIECNPRFTMANSLVRRAGIDLALVAYNRVTGAPLPRLAPARDGLAMWYPYDDLRALRDYRRSGELSVASWLATLAHRQHPPFFVWHDPMPTLARLSERARLTLDSPRWKMRQAHDPDAARAAASQPVPARSPSAD